MFVVLIISIYLLCFKYNVEEIKHIYLNSSNMHLIKYTLK